MARLAPALSSFVLAALAAHAGLATAGNDQAFAGVAPATIESSVAAAGAGPVLWPALISRRLASLTWASSNPSSSESGPLGDRVDTLLARHGRRARVGVHVRDLTRDVVLLDRDGSALLKAASNQKLLTAAAGLELLGAEYRFQTRVLRHGDALYLIGEGDPSLHLRDLHRLATSVLAAGGLAGVRRLVADPSAFSPDSLGPGYDPAGPGHSYQAPSGALSLAWNTVEITVEPGEFGQRARVAVEPESDHLVVLNRTTTGHGRPLEVETHAGPDGRTLVEVSGSIYAGHHPVVERRRITDPAKFTGGAFAHVLAQMSSSPQLPVEIGVAPTGAVQVASHESEPLALVLESAMRFSNNFTTEQVLRTLAWRSSGRAGSWADGLAALRNFRAAIGEPSIQFVNGSGLSAATRASARSLVDVLALAHRGGRASEALLTALPSAGGEGTLHLRLVEGGRRVRAKTGTMSGVTALSGLVASVDGKTILGFSILVEGGEAASGRALQDRIVRELLSHAG